MTDPTGDRPERRPERLPARRPAGEVAPGAAPSRDVERFTAPRQTRAIGGLTPERAAKIVRQSGDARWVAFLGLVIVALFVIVYYFYQLFGIPFLSPTPLLTAQEEEQQVVAVERGYNLYQANCARCHGVDGEGGIGPVLHDQMKLFQHLNEQYLRNVLEVGGRYVCGNPRSLMPVWAEENGGPLNYIQIEDIIAFIRSDATKEYERRDPELNEPVLDEDGNVITFRGWIDPSFRPDPAATPVPDCHSGGTATQAPPASLDPNAPVLELGTAGVLEYDTHELTVAAGTTFVIHFVNSDEGQMHDVDIRDSGNTTLQDQQPITGPAEANYQYTALEPGTYTFICSVHPIPAMTGTLTVE
ncbi:MAG TPA: c-type cytochrome [Candidatus Binatia bacterium]|nr:c-type cytochrome [Candidatus Binatia bacterium]